MFYFKLELQKYTSPNINETLGLVPVLFHFGFPQSLRLGLVHLLIFQEVSFSALSQNISLADQWQEVKKQMTPLLEH